MEQYSKQIEAEVAKFRKGVEKIRTSDNPYYADVKVQDYEIRKLREQLEKNVEEIKAKFTTEIDAKIAEMEPVAAKSFFKPTESDRRLVDEYVSEFLADAKLSYSDSDKLDAFERFEYKLGYLEENGLHEARKRLPEIAEKLKDDETLQKKLRGMNATFRELRTSEQFKLDELKEAKINGVDSAFRRLRLTHPAYSDYKNNRANFR
ncbi:hypothetical protein R4Z09_10835 [Niallia oryzisoli]|uniref:Uncharacterized protein n=1 Tax=Niallia oryzisoli TaxID=1737571 RepID=A0ABZ2CJ57_9BACI